MAHEYAIPNTFDADQKREYIDACNRHLAEMIDGYKKLHNSYSAVLQAEYAYELKGNKGDEPDRNELKNAKTELYSIIEPLLKHILARFVYAPLQGWGGGRLKDEEKCPRMLDWVANFYMLADAVRQVLIDNSIGENIDIAAMTEGKDARNDAGHAYAYVPCVSYIRVANIARQIICLLAPEQEGMLPTFPYPDFPAFDIADFLERCIDEFDDKNSILVVGSLHDIPVDRREIIANIPWKVVIDLDAASEHGGLFSACLSSANKQLFDDNVIKKFISCPISSRVAWLKDGDTIQKWSAAGRKNGFVDKNCSPKSLPDYRKAFMKKLEKIINFFKLDSKYINLVCIASDYKTVASSVKDLCAGDADLYGKCTVTFVYTYTAYEESILLSANGYGDEDDFFRVYNTSLGNFFSELSKYRSNIPNVPPKSDARTLPGRNEAVAVSENNFIEFSRYFEPLYSDIAQADNIGGTRKKLNDFYEGRNIVPWGVLEDYTRVADLRPCSNWKFIEKKVCEKLDRIDDSERDIQERIFYLHYRPGIGGSTLLRQIGWSLHEKYPVIIVTGECGTEMERLIKDQIYDNLKKGVLILADNDYADIDKLERMVKRFRDFASVLIVAKRQRAREGKSDGNIIRLVKIEDDTIDHIRKIYKNYIAEEKQIGEAEISKRAKNYDRLGMDASVRMPFFIGLTYLEKEFVGVNGYVNKAFNEIGKITTGVSLLRSIRYMALLDKFAYKPGLPVAFVKFVASGVEAPDESSDLWRNTPALKDIVSKKGGCYYSRHPLISDHIMEKYEEQFQTKSEALRTLATLLIDDVFAYLRRNRSAEFANLSNSILNPLFISRKYFSSDNDLGVSYEDKDFSGRRDDFSVFVQELINVGSHNSACSLLEKFASVAEAFAHDHHNEHDVVMEQAAHAYGHLSRLHYKVRESRDLDKAQGEADKAISCMEAANRQIESVYHMAGEALFAQVQDKLSVWNVHSKYINAGAIEEIEEKIDKALERYKKIVTFTTQRDSLRYAVFGILQILIRYLEKISEISANEYTPKQEAYASDIDEYMSIIDEDDFDDKARELYYTLMTRYKALRSKKEHGIPSVAFYRRLLSKKQGNCGIMERNAVKMQLVRAIFNEFRDEENNYHINWQKLAKSDKKARDLMELLDQIVRGGMSTGKVYQYRTIFASWMQMAKICGTSLDRADEVVKRWLDVEKGVKAIYDPRPQYYWYVINYLRILRGDVSIDLNALSINTKDISAKSGGINTKVIHDYFVDSKKNNMSQLHYSRITSREELQKSLVTATGTKLRAIKGRLKEVESKIGLVKISDPWDSKHEIIAKFRVGEKNDLSENQISHEVVFYGGFSFEGIRALASTVKDITSGDTLENSPKKTSKKYT